MVVGFLFVVLLVALISTVVYGRRVIARERTDAVFGNPVRAMGGWYWVVAGISTILILWFYFSWDMARAFFPLAGNELCQVAKLNRASNPIRAAFPPHSRLLQATGLLQREYGQIDALEARLNEIAFAPTERSELQAILVDMRAALAAQADPTLVDPDVAVRFDHIAERIQQLIRQLASAAYPGPANPVQQAAALAQPGWGRSSIELPPLAITDRGRRFAAASVVMQHIADDYTAIKNISPALTARLDALQQRYRSVTGGVAESAELSAQRTLFLKQIDKAFKRIDDGRIFPAATTQTIEAALLELEREQLRRQGTLRYINVLAMPGGEILAGNQACSEQGSGRWLPKPSDTLATFVRMVQPDAGYKGFPLLWYKMQPVAQILGALTPDWIADLVPGEYPRHDNTGQVRGNFKSGVYDVATGNYTLFSIPVPTGHVWDSIVRVLTGLFFGIILGVPLGLFMGLSRFAKGYFDPLIELYRPIPPLAWAPLILTIFGIQDDGKIFLLFMVAFAIMVISARTGATGTQLSKIHAAHSLGSSKRQIIRQVILPNSLPEILTGIRIAIGVCWGTLVAAEMLAGTTGIGFIENVARKQSDYEIIWMTIILLGLLGLMFDLMMRWVIRHAIPWRGKG